MKHNQAFKFHKQFVKVKNVAKGHSRIGGGEPTFSHSMKSVPMHLVKLFGQGEK